MQREEVSCKRITPRETRLLQLGSPVGLVLSSKSGVVWLSEFPLPWDPDNIHTGQFVPALLGDSACPRHTAQFNPQSSSSSQQQPTINVFDQRRR